MATRKKWGANPPPVDPPSEPLFDAGFQSACDALARAFQRGRGGGDADALLLGRARGEFAGVRPYATGDDLRDLDWAAYARSERLYVREFHRERGGDLLILLDRSASMAEPGKWRAARRGAGAFGYLGARAGLSPRVEWRGRERGASGALPTLGSRARFLSWARPLESLRAEPPGSAGTEVVGATLARPVGGRGELVVISDLLGGAFSRERAQAAPSLGWRVTLVQVLAAEELAPGPGPVALRDAEGDGELVLDLDERERALYEHEVAALVEGWRRFALAHGMRYMLCDARVGILDSLRDALRSGAMGS